MISGIEDDDWKRLSPLLDEALELSAAELDPWLEHLTATHPAVATILRELLTEDAELKRSRFLEDPPGGSFAPATQQDIEGTGAAMLRLRRLDAQKAQTNQTLLLC